MKTILFLLALAGALSAQYVRVDPIPALTIASQTTGVLPPVLAMPYSSIAVCNAPASGNPCTNFATTYQSASGGTCPQSQQVVLSGTQICGNQADAQGNFGFWLPPGQYFYTITFQGFTFGPYPITAALGSTFSFLNFVNGTQAGLLSMDQNGFLNWYPDSTPNEVILNPSGTAANTASPSLIFKGIGGGGGAVTAQIGVDSGQNLDIISSGTTNFSNSTSTTIAQITNTAFRIIPFSASPGCSTTADIGKFWIDNTTSTTAIKVCKSVSGAVGWSTISTTP